MILETGFGEASPRGEFPVPWEVLHAFLWVRSSRMSIEGVSTPFPIARWFPWAKVCHRRPRSGRDANARSAEPLGCPSRLRPDGRAVKGAPFQSRLQNVAGNMRASGQRDPRPSEIMLPDISSRGWWTHVPCTRGGVCPGGAKPPTHLLLGASSVSALEPGGQKGLRRAVGRGQGGHRQWKGTSVHLHRRRRLPCSRAVGRTGW